MFPSWGNQNHKEKKKLMLMRENSSIHQTTRLRDHTHVLDIIRGYCLVVAINGTLSYNNNVQPFLISTVLEKYKKHKYLKTWQKTFCSATSWIEQWRMISEQNARKLRLVAYCHLYFATFLAVWQASQPTWNYLRKLLENHPFPLSVPAVGSPLRQPETELYSLSSLNQR